MLMIIINYDYDYDYDVKYVKYIKYVKNDVDYYYEQVNVIIINTDEYVHVCWLSFMEMCL